MKLFYNSKVCTYIYVLEFIIHHSAEHLRNICILVGNVDGGGSQGIKICKHWFCCKGLVIQIFVLPPSHHLFSIGCVLYSSLFVGEMRIIKGRRENKIKNCEDFLVHGPNRHCTII